MKEKTNKRKVTKRKKWAICGWISALSCVGLAIYAFLTGGTSSSNRGLLSSAIESLLMIGGCIGLAFISLIFFVQMKSYCKYCGNTRMKEVDRYGTGRSKTNVTVYDNSAKSVTKYEKVITYQCPLCGHTKVKRTYEDY